MDQAYKSGGFNPLSCGAFTATYNRENSVEISYYRKFQSPFMRGLHCDNCREYISVNSYIQLFQSPFMRGLHCDHKRRLLGPFEISVSFNPLSCGAFTATETEASQAHLSPRFAFQSPFMRGLHCDLSHHPA